MAAQAVNNNCFNNAYLSIVSIPRTIQLKIEECSSTDFKVYGFVVLGAALQAAAVVGVAAIIFAATATGPFALFGLIPALLIGALGLYMSIRPEDVEDTVCPPSYIPGQPVGLVNRGNNCWANAALQLVCNSPTLIHSPAIQEVPQMLQLTQAYTAAQQNQNRVVQNVDGQLVRDYLRARAPQSFGPEQGQEDAAEGLSYLFENRPLYELNEIQRVPEGNPVINPLPGSVMTLSLEDTPDPDFLELLERQFNYQRVDGAEIELKFTTAPDDLLIQLNRFLTRPDPATGQQISYKNTNPIRIPPNLELAPDYFLDNHGVNYTCDGFVVHLGNSMNAGHYITFLRRPDNTWWLCNDRRVRQVTDQYAHRMMREAYICHFSKRPPVAQ